MSKYQEIIDDHVSGMSDKQLLEALEEAHGFLLHAAKNQPKSEWHECCSVGVVIYQKEANKRGLNKPNIH